MTKAITEQFKNGLGSFVWWDLDRTQVEPHRLRDILTNEGIATIVPDIDSAGAVRRAAREWGKGRGNADRYKAEVTYQTATEMGVGILRHDRVDGQTVGWTQVELVVYDLAGDRWVNQHTTSEADEFVALANKRLMYLDHQWIRPEIIQAELAKMMRISLRRQGGIYFVPTTFAGELKRLQRVVAALGSSRLHVATVDDDDDGRESIGASLNDHVVRHLSEVEDKLSQWEESSRQVRSDSQATLLGELRELLDHADLYEGALNVKLDTLKDKVKACKKRALNILADKAA